jgi:hypothetical protein
LRKNGMQGQGATVEAMRRLRVAIEKSSAKSDTYSRRMLLLTIVLIVLTLVCHAPPSSVCWYSLTHCIYLQVIEQ